MAVIRYIPTPRLPGLLDSEMQERARLSPTGLQLQLTLHDTWQATMTLPDGGPAVRLRDWISLYDSEGLVGIFRVTNLAETVGRQTQATLLHGIDILSDSVWTPASGTSEHFSGNMTQFLTALLDRQTHLVDGVKPWVLGTCESSEVISRDIGYTRLSELLADAVPEGGSHYLEFDQGTFPWTVSLREKTTEITSEFRLRRNITSAGITYNDADLCTRLILSNTSGGESALRVYDAGAGAQSAWGIVTKIASIDTSDTLSSPTWPEAEAWAADFFRQYAQPSVQIQIDGIQLKELTGEDWDRADLGRLCRVALPDTGRAIEERVVGISWPDLLRSPQRVTVSLANSLPEFSETIKLLQKQTRSAAGSARAAQVAAEEAAEQVVIYHTELIKTDREVTALASATGIMFNQDGTPVLDENDEFVYNPDAPESAIISKISVQAGQITSLTETTSGLSSRVTQTESAITTEVTNRTNADSDLSSRITQNATSISSEVTRAQGAESSLSSRITQNATSIAAKVSAGDVATQLALEVGNVTITGGNLVVDGMITSSSLSTINISTTGNLIASEIEAVNILRASTIDCENGTIFAGAISTGEGGEDYLHGTAVIDTQVVPDGTGYKLQKKMYGSTSWTDAGSFSRAASTQTVSGSWSGSTYHIVADENGSLPLDETLSFAISTTPSGGASSTTIDRFSNLHRNMLTISGSSQQSGAYIKQYTIDASGVYTDGQTNGRAQAVTDATLSVDTPYKLGNVIKIFPRVTFDASTEKSANPMDAQLPALATNSSGTPTPAPATLVAGSTVYPYVQIGTEYFYGGAVAVPSGTTVNVESSHSHTMTANTQTVTPGSGYDAMAQVAVDATPRYYAGKAAVVLSDTLTWGTTPASGITVSQNSVQISTSGRTNTSGTAEERTKTVNLYSQASTSGLTATFFVTHTDSTDANRILKKTATCSDSNLTAANIKSGVSIFGVTGTYTGGGGNGYFLGFSDQRPTSGGEWYPYSGGTISTSKTIYAIVENSQGDPTAGTSITVRAPAEKTIAPKASTITSNQTYYASDDGVDGWSSVTVNVGGYSNNMYLYRITGELYIYDSGDYIPVSLVYQGAKWYYSTSSGASTSNRTVYW